MKTRFLAVTAGSVFFASVFFTLFFESSFEKEHYGIDLIGLKDAYLVANRVHFLI